MLAVAVFILSLLSVEGAPATLPADMLRTWYVQLADSDPDVRERARIDLMGIERGQLPHLRQIVADTRPIKAAQAAVLYDIVSHVFMATEPYEANPRAGFLGVRLPESLDAEALVTGRVPGFCAYRMLQDGDVIVGIAELPGVKFPSRTQFTNAIRAIPAGTRLTLHILRNGQNKSVALRLDARPTASDPPNSMSDLENDRKEKADAYWARHFAPLLPEHVTNASP